MEQAHSNKKYILYYDESNNIRSLVLKEDQYNIDNDPKQTSSPIFILAGIATREDKDDINFQELINKLRLQKTSNELKFSQLVKIKSSHTPNDALKIALNNDGSLGIPVEATTCSIMRKTEHPWRGSPHEQ